MNILLLRVYTFEGAKRPLQIILVLRPSIEQIAQQSTCFYAASRDSRIILPGCGNSSNHEIATFTIMIIWAVNRRALLSLYNIPSCNHTFARKKTTKKTIKCNLWASSSWELSPIPPPKKKEPAKWAASGISRESHLEEMTPHRFFHVLVVIAKTIDLLSIVMLQKMFSSSLYYALSFVMYASINKKHLFYIWT